MSERGNNEDQSAADAIVQELAPDLLIYIARFGGTDPDLQRGRVNDNRPMLVSWRSNQRGIEMATWSLCARSLASSGVSSEPIYINLENVLTVERHADITTVTMVGGHTVVVDTIPEKVIKPE